MAIKQCADDMSPYVRKAACIAAAKVYSLEPELKADLVEIISKKLGDNNIMVLGAAIFAFDQICPDSFELIHEHYRKLCKFMVDCDEWCQILLLNVLTRYARSQFLSPFKVKKKEKLNSSLSGRWSFKKTKLLL
jgi:AP-3 complex subunit beta